MTVVLKLGGSLITEKGEAETVDEPALATAAGAIASAAVERLVVVHGGGSFGHAAAAEHGVSRTAGTHDADTVRGIHGSMGRLLAAVLDALSDQGVPAVPVRPLSAATRGADGQLSLAVAPVDRLVTEGFVPVLHGDVVAHAGRGATILSGDEIVTSLAGSLGADRVGLCSTVPGVLDVDGQVLERVSAFDDVAEAVGGSEDTDVTGGMAGKVRTLLALDAPAHVFGSEDLATFLAGGEPGTRIG